MVDLGIAVGVPIAILLVLLVTVVVVILVCWKCKLRRKYSMNVGETPVKQLTRHEESIKKSTPPAKASFKNGSLKERPEILLRTPSREADLYVVRHSYSSADQLHLKLQMGRIVEVTTKQENGWWKGTVEDQTGWFPSEYVKKIDAGGNKTQGPKKREAPPTPASNGQTTPVAKQQGAPSNNKEEKEIEASKAEKRENVPKKDRKFVVSNKPVVDADGYTMVMLEPDEGASQAKSEESKQTKLPDLDNMEENQVQGYINDIFTMEDESPRDGIQDKIKATTAGMVTSASKIEIEDTTPPTTPPLNEFDLKIMNSLKRAKSSEVNFDKPHAYLASPHEPDVTIGSKESFEMRQSFGPESTFEMLDETQDISLPHTVKSNSPSSLGAVVGVMTSGAWQAPHDDHMTTTNDVITINDEYSHDSSDSAKDKTRNSDDEQKFNSLRESSKKRKLNIYSEKEPIPKEKLKLNLSAMEVPIDADDNLDKPAAKTASISMDREEKATTFVAMYTYSATHDAQLSLAPNDVIMVKDTNHLNGWIRGYKRDHPNQEGWFPMSYVREGASTNQNSANLLQVPNNTSQSLSEPELSDCDFQDQSFEEDLTGMAYQAKYPYTATAKGDLSFIEGDTIVVVEMLENGWWRGVLDARSGWFPGSYVEVIPQTPMVDLSAPSWPNASHGAEIMPGKENSNENSSAIETSVSSDSATPKPDLPKRFVIPKLMTVKSGGNIQNGSSDRPARPPPPAPPGDERKAPPRRKNSNNSKQRRDSHPRPNMPPPPLPNADSERKIASQSEDGRKLSNTSDGGDMQSDAEISGILRNNDDKSLSQTDAKELDDEGVTVHGKPIISSLRLRMSIQRDHCHSPPPLSPDVDEIILNNSHPQFHSTPHHNLKLDIDAAENMVMQNDNLAVESQTSPTARQLNFEESSYSPQNVQKSMTSQEPVTSLRQSLKSQSSQESASPPVSPIKLKKRVSFSEDPIEIVPEMISMSADGTDTKNVLTESKHMKLTRAANLGFKDISTDEPQIDTNTHFSTKDSESPKAVSPEKPMISAKPVLSPQPMAPTRKPKITSPKPQAPTSPNASVTKPTRPTSPPVKKGKAPPIPTQALQVAAFAPNNELDLSSISATKSNISDSMIANKGDETSLHLPSFEQTLDFSSTSVKSPDDLDNHDTTRGQGQNTDDFLSQMLNSFEDIKTKTEMSLPSEAEIEVEIEEKVVKPDIATYDARSPSLSISNSNVDESTNLFFAFQKITGSAQESLSDTSKPVEISDVDIKASDVELNKHTLDTSGNFGLNTLDIDDATSNISYDIDTEVSYTSPAVAQLLSAKIHSDSDNVTQESEVFECKILENSQELQSDTSKGCTQQISLVSNNAIISSDSKQEGITVNTSLTRSTSNEVDIPLSPQSPDSLPDKVKIKRYQIDKPATIKLDRDNDGYYSRQSSTQSQSNPTSPRSEDNVHKSLEWVPSPTSQTNEPIETETSSIQSPVLSVSPKGDIFLPGSNPIHMETNEIKPGAAQNFSYTILTDIGDPTAMKYDSTPQDLNNTDNSNEMSKSDRNYDSDARIAATSAVLPTIEITNSTPKPQAMPSIEITNSTPKPQVMPSIEITNSTPKPQAMPSIEITNSTPKPQAMPSIEMTNSTPKTQTMSRGLESSSADHVALGASNEELHKLHVDTLVDADRLSLTDLLPDPNIRPDTPNSGISIGSEPPPLPSVPPPMELDDGQLQPYIGAENVSKLSVDSAHEAYTSVLVDSAHEAYISGNDGCVAVSDNRMTHFTRVEQEGEVHENVTESSAALQEHNINVERTPPMNKQLLNKDSLYELMATSPYVVIRTPQSKREAQNFDSVEISTYEKSTEINTKVEHTETEAKELSSEAPDTKPLSVAGGFSMHLSSLFGKIFKGDDHLNEGSHPVNKIHFRRSTPDVSLVHDDSETLDTHNSSANNKTVLRSQSVTSQSSYRDKTSTFPLENSDDRVSSLPNTSSSSSLDKVSPQKPPRRSRSQQSRSLPSDSSIDDPTSLAKTEGNVSSAINTEFKLPPLNPAPWSKSTVNSISSSKEIVSEQSTQHVSPPQSPSNTTGHFQLNNNTKHMNNAMRFFSPSGFKATEFDSVLNATNDLHLNTQHNGHDGEYMNIVTHVEPVTSENDVTHEHSSEFHLKDFDSPQPFHLTHSYGTKLSRISSFDARSDGIVAKAFSDPDDDVIEL